MNRYKLGAVFLGFMVVAGARPVSAAQAPSIDKPLKPPATLVLEDVLKSGTMVNVAKYYGRPLVLAGLCPE